MSFSFSSSKNFPLLDSSDPPWLERKEKLTVFLLRSQASTNVRSTTVKGKVLPLNEGWSVESYISLNISKYQIETVDLQFKVIIGHCINWEEPEKSWYLLEIFLGAEKIPSHRITFKGNPSEGYKTKHILVLYTGCAHSMYICN